MNLPKAWVIHYNNLFSKYVYNIYLTSLDVLIIPTNLFKSKIMWNHDVLLSEYA